MKRLVLRTKPHEWNFRAIEVLNESKWSFEKWKFQDKFLVLKIT